MFYERDGLDHDHEGRSMRDVFGLCNIATRCIGPRRRSAAKGKPVFQVPARPALEKGASVGKIMALLARIMHGGLADVA